MPIHTHKILLDVESVYLLLYKCARLFIVIFSLSRHFQIRQQILGADCVRNGAGQGCWCRCMVVKFYPMLKVCTYYYTNVLGCLSSFFSLSRHFQIRQQILGADGVRNSAGQGCWCRCMAVKFYPMLKVCTCYYTYVLECLSSFLPWVGTCKLGNKYKMPIRSGMVVLKGADANPWL